MSPQRESTLFSFLVVYMLYSFGSCERWGCLNLLDECDGRGQAGAGMGSTVVILAGPEEIEGGRRGDNSDLPK